MIALVILAIVFIASLVLEPVKPRFSYRELKRRRSRGLSGAERDHLRAEQFIRLGAVISFAQLGLLISCVIVASRLYGATSASLLAAAGLALFVAARYRLAGSKLGGRLYRLVEPKLITASQFMAKFTPWLAYRQPKIQLASKIELLELVEDSPDALTKLDRQRLISSLNYSSQKLTDCMINWSDVETVDKSELLGPLRLDELHKTGYTQFPVMSGSGLVGLLDISHLVTLKSKRSLTAGSVMTDIYTIEQQRSIDQALYEFVQNSQTILVVRDGKKPVGIIQLADTLEQLTGINYQSPDLK